MFIVICGPLVPGKRPGCGGERTSLNYIFRGLLNIPNQRYETHLAMWIGEKTIRFANVKHLLFVTNRCCFVKISDKSLNILMGVYCKDSRISPKLEVFPANWLIALNLQPGNDLVSWFSPCIFIHSSWALTPTFLCCFVTQDKSAEFSPLTFAKNCLLFWVESNFFTIFL